MIARGAGHFRQPGLVERLGRALSAIPMNATVRARLKRWYLAALTAQSGGKGLTATLRGGESIRVLPEHAHLGWNPDEYLAFRGAVRPGMTALDVGANAGAYALLLGQWVGPHGAVYAFEPAPDPFEGLVRHLALNGLDKVVHAERMAVGGSTTTAHLLVSSDPGESRLASASESSSATVDVPVTTVDDFCAARRLMPSFIKVDVEGAELEVLRGARETIRRCRSDLALFVELHPRVWPALGISRTDIAGELARQSLEAVSLLPGQDPWSVEGLCVRLVPCAS
jgi:FkbM family methyltransferase